MVRQESRVGLRCGIVAVQGLQQTGDAHHRFGVLRVNLMRACAEAERRQVFALLGQAIAVAHHARRPAGIVLAKPGRCIGRTVVGARTAHNKARKTDHGQHPQQRAAS
ncbi:MAG TPA: hypothetical protein EYP07_13935 [Kiloniellaceae bacterium]|nr:hypothetical protein [Kiloniellaceae bacterium]